MTKCKQNKNGETEDIFRQVATNDGESDMPDFLVEEVRLAVATVVYSR